MRTRKSFYAKELQKQYGKMTFGRFLIAWRESEGMTQAQFAKRLDLSAANLCDLEQGRRIPSPVRAKKIAKRLGLPEKGLIALALQDALHDEGLLYAVILEEEAA
ncbi:MAG: helix-turn-helix transcriptional regulator [Deltaproteobacteria bacterium]|nr:helix-turn-helix transcriptional regulator [Deltaproteobacteria bacterium]